MVEALGTIARSGTKAFIDRLEAAQGGGRRAAHRPVRRRLLLGLHGRRRVEVVSRRAGSDEAWLWSSDGKGPITIAPSTLDEAPARGTRVVLHLMEDARVLRRALHARADRQGAVRPCAGADRRSSRSPAPSRSEIADGAALWTKPKAEITPEEYTDFYRSVAGQFDEPALTVHFRAEGRHEYTVLAFVPGSRPFDLFDPDRKGRMKLYVRRVFITDEAELLPRLSALRARPGRHGRPAAQRLARDDPGEPDPGARSEGRDQPRPAASSTSSRRTTPRPIAKVWETFGAGAQGRPLRGLRAARARCSASPASRPRPPAADGARSRTMSPR